MLHINNIPYFSATLFRPENYVEQNLEIDEVLLNRLYRYKENLIYWAIEFGNVPLKQWATQWLSACLCPNPHFRDFVKENDQQLVNDIDLQQLEDFARAVLFFEHAIENFNSGEFEKSLGTAFQVEHMLGKKQGREEECTRQNKKKAGKDNRYSKRVVIEYYANNDLQKISAEEVARKILKDNIVKMSNRKLAEYINGYRNLLKKCDHTESGKRIFKHFKEAQEKIQSHQDFPEAEINKAKSILSCCATLEKNMIDVFVQMNLEDAELICTILQENTIKELFKIA